MSAVTMSGYVPISQELMVDGLPIRTMFWPVGDRVAEYLRYGQSVAVGARRFNPTDVSESVEWVEWDDNSYLPYLDEDDE